jgi:hypothetical protein
MIRLFILALVAQAQGAVPTLTLSPAPTLTIADDGTPATQFVRVMGVMGLSNGGVAIANRGTNDVRIFDARGKHVATFGRTGDGPGEFRRLELIGRSDDTAWFYDSGAQRTTAAVLGPKPELLGTTRITATGNRGSFSVTGRLPDGRWVATTNVSPTFDNPQGVHRLPGSTGIIAKAGDGAVSWLGDFKSAAIFVHSPTRDIKDAATGPIAFPPWLRTATGDGQIWIGDSAGDSLVVVRTRDMSRFTVRLPIASRTPSRELVNSERAAELEQSQSPSGKAFTEAKYSAKYLPERLPFFESLIPGPSGELWVQEYSGRRASPAQYIILDVNGRPKGRVRVPGGSRVRDVGADYVILAHEDVDGVESIRVHRLSRPGSNP